MAFVSDMLRELAEALYFRVRAN